MSEDVKDKNELVCWNTFEIYSTGKTQLYKLVFAASLNSVSDLLNMLQRLSSVLIPVNAKFPLVKGFAGSYICSSVRMGTPSDGKNVVTVYPTLSWQPITWIDRFTPELGQDEGPKTIYSGD